MNQNYTTIPIFTISEIRKMAKKQLKGKWLAVLPVMLVFMLFVTIPALILQFYNYNTEMANLSAMLDSEPLMPDTYFRFAALRISTV